MQIFGKGFNFSQDGPGNRLVYHLSGCNMKCIWCSNPQGLVASAGKNYSITDILAECISSKPMFFSGGGVTFTGGEASLQHGELLQLLVLLKENHIHTAIETNGATPQLPELAKYIDYLIMDFKHYDSSLLKKYTGKDNKIIKKNFEYFCREGRQLHVRIPLINHINTEDPKGFTDYFKKHNTENVVFEFLAYHEYGKDKWTEEYLVKDGFITPAIIKKFKDEFNNNNLKILTT